jgi:hypothetical protein
MGSAGDLVKARLPARVMSRPPECGHTTGPVGAADRGIAPFQTSLREVGVEVTRAEEPVLRRIALQAVHEGVCLRLSHG